jgi:hypothetical protein
MWLLLATLFAPCWMALQGCGDDGNNCIGVGCNDEVGESGEQPIPGCWPEFAVQNDEAAVEGITYTCQGSGNGFAVLTYRNALDVVKDQHACLHPPQGNAGPTMTECLENPMDLAELEIGGPWVCCTEDSEDIKITDACHLDCGYAACKTTLQQIESMAAAIDPLGDGWLAQLRTDLESYAEILALPDQQRLCAEAVRAAAGEVVAVKLGEAPSKDQPGHIESLTVHMQCGIELTEQLDGAGVCTQSAHTPDQPDAQDQDGLVFGGSASYVGPEGEGSSELVTGGLALRVPDCTNAPCTVTLTKLDARFENASLPGLELTGIVAHLLAPAQAWRMGDDLLFPAGTLRFEVQARVLLEGAHLSEVPGTIMQVSNVEPATGSFDGEGSFTLDAAVFATGDYQVILHVEPSP